jgi:hypothetical protein
MPQKALTVIVRAGRPSDATKSVKSPRPTDLVFQSVKEGKPMRDNNVLVWFIKPAAELEPNWNQMEPKRRKAHC